jgi:ClpP class serine protease
VSSNLTSPTFFSIALKYSLHRSAFGVSKMYKDILTMCWSIKEVNKNLSDRKSVSEYSIKYLKNACSELASMMRKMAKSMPDETLEVVDKTGHKKSIALKDVAEMLYDARKIMELNLIDNVGNWANARMDAAGGK